MSNFFFEGFPFIEVFFKDDVKLKTTAGKLTQPLLLTMCSLYPRTWLQDNTVSVEKHDLFVSALIVLPFR